MNAWRIFLASVWLANGFLAKLLNLVPRHQDIVARILGYEHAFLFTKLIGIAEVLMAIWILTGIKSRLCAAMQIALILIMNGIEFFLAPDLLLWGRLNLLFAFLFMIVVGYIEFRKEPSILQS